MRIALIHATRLAIEPVAEAFVRHWPGAALMNLLDDTLSVDRAASGLTDPITHRIQSLARYAMVAGADGILFTCSAFGPAIEAVDAEAAIPVLKPNEAMFTEALAIGGSIGLLASFAPSLSPMKAEFATMAVSSGQSPSLITACVPEAMSALSAGDRTAHDRHLADAAAKLSGAETILMAQFSTARAREAVAAASGKRVLTSPDSAVLEMRRRLLGS